MWSRGSFRVSRGATALRVVANTPTTPALTSTTSTVAAVASACAEPSLEPVQLLRPKHAFYSTQQSVSHPQFRSIADETSLTYCGPLHIVRFSRHFRVDSAIPQAKHSSRSAIGSSGRSGFPACSRSWSLLLRTRQIPGGCTNSCSWVVGEWHDLWLP